MTEAQRQAKAAEIRDLHQRYEWLYGDAFKRWSDNSWDLRLWTGLIRRR